MTVCERLRMVDGRRVSDQSSAFLHTSSIHHNDMKESRG
jgi:hypothetical protein